MNLLVITPGSDHLRQRRAKTGGGDESTRTAIIAYKRSWRGKCGVESTDFHKERKKNQKRKKDKEGEACGKCRS
jgi:hypothetical protein